MSHNFFKEKEKLITQIINDETNKTNEKKSLEEILSSFLGKKSFDEKYLKRLKKEFLNINFNGKGKTSFELLKEIQEKLSKVCSKIDEEKISSKESS